LQTSSFQFSVGSIQQEKRVLLKTENPKLHTTGLFAKVLFEVKQGWHSTIVSAFFNYG
jgi:hypothetical protein